MTLPRIVTDATRTTRANLLKSPRSKSRPVSWTAAARHDLVAYLEQLQVLMRLVDWNIEVDWTPAAEGTCATITPTDGQRRAVLFLAEDFLAQPPHDQRATLVHELTHCHLFPVSETVRLGNAAALGKVPADMMWAIFMSQVEYATDALAETIAPNMPLPPWS